MYDNYNYPMGADGPDAPWNRDDREPEPLDFDITYSCGLFKSTSVETSDYYPGDEWEEGEWEDGEYTRSWVSDPPDTSDTDWLNAYQENHESPLYLIAKLKDLCIKEIKNLEDLIDNLDEDDIKSKRIFQGELRKYKYLRDECEGWEISDAYAEKD